MSAIGSTNVAQTSISEFRSFVEGDKKVSNGTILRLPDGLKTRSFHPAKGDFVGNIGRSAETKSANNQARAEFLKTIAGIFGNSEKDIPPEVKKAMKFNDFGLDEKGNVTSGKPLTARRIRETLAAVEKNLDLDQIAAKADTETIKSFAKLLVKNNVPLADVAVRMKNAAAFHELQKTTARKEAAQIANFIKDTGCPIPKGCIRAYGRQLQEFTVRLRERQIMRGQSPTDALELVKEFLKPEDLVSKGLLDFAPKSELQSRMAAKVKNAMLNGKDALPQSGVSSLTLRETRPFQVKIDGAPVPEQPTRNEKLQFDGGAHQADEILKPSSDKDSKLNAGCDSPSAQALHETLIGTFPDNREVRQAVSYMLSMTNGFASAMDEDYSLKQFSVGEEPGSCGNVAYEMRPEYEITTGQDKTVLKIKNHEGYAFTSDMSKKYTLPGEDRGLTPPLVMISQAYETEVTIDNKSKDENGLPKFEINQIAMSDADDGDVVMADMLEQVDAKQKEVNSFVESNKDILNTLKGGASEECLQTIHDKLADEKDGWLVDAFKNDLKNDREKTEETGITHQFVREINAKFLPTINGAPARSVRNDPTTDPANGMGGSYKNYTESELCKAFVEQFKELIPDRAMRAFVAETIANNGVQMSINRAIMQGECPIFEGQQEKGEAFVMKMLGKNTIVGADPLRGQEVDISVDQGAGNIKLTFNTGMGVEVDGVKLREYRFATQITIPLNQELKFGQIPKFEVSQVTEAF